MTCNQMILMGLIQIDIQGVLKSKSKLKTYCNGGLKNLLLQSDKVFDSESKNSDSTSLGPSYSEKKNYFQFLCKMTSCVGVEIFRTFKFFLATEGNQRAKITTDRLRIANYIELLVQIFDKKYP